MENEHAIDRLSWGDTVFLNLERDGMPLNVASVCVFEGKMSFAEVVRFVESKLPQIPRYLKRVVAAPLGLGLPHWEYDPGFDVTRHVREIRLKRGTDAELKGVAAKLFSTVMDRQHPLWDITVVHGMRANRTAVIFRLHHCLADGIAGVALMNLLLDPTPRTVRPTGRKFRLRIPRPVNTWSSLAGAVVDSCSEIVARLLSEFADLLSVAQRAAGSGRDLLLEQELSRLLPEITSFTQRVRFNVVYRGPQKFAWTEVPLADVKAIKNAFGAHVNDVLLTLVTATVQRYLRLHGDSVKGRLLRIMVPVNRREAVHNGDLGNRISLVPVTVPLDIRDLGKLLMAVHRRTEFLKHSDAADLVSFAGGLLGLLPLPVQEFAGPQLSQLPITPFNMVCTNVPGPQQPLYLLGHKMVCWYPYVPVGGELALNCAALSYDGQVYFGFSGDVHAAPDLRRMEALLAASFHELRKAAGVTARRKTTRTRVKAQAASTPAANKADIHELLPPDLPPHLPGPRLTSESIAEEEESLVGA